MSGTRILAGRYRLGHELGRGGMAVVTLGLDIRLGRAVAIKQLTDQFRSDRAARALFETEARFAAKLNDPSVVRIFDSGVDVDVETGVSTPFIVTEYVAGQTLRSHLRREGRLDAVDALRITCGVLDALTCCHDAGVVHSDIKPGNVMLTRTGQIKLMDFGLARSLVAPNHHRTVAGAGFGTTNYLSPEQVRGELADVRSDIYSTGCLLYELLVGKPPFRGDSYADVAYQHLASIPAKPSELRPGLGTTLDEVALRCLAKDPQARYQTARELRADLAGLLTRMAPADAGAVRVVDPERQPTEATRTPLVDEVGPRRKTHMRRLALVACGVAGLLVPLSTLSAQYASGPPAAKAAGAISSDVAAADRPEGDESAGPRQEERQQDPAQRGNTPGPASEQAAGRVPADRLSTTRPNSDRSASPAAAHEGVLAAPPISAEQSSQALPAGAPPQQAGGKPTTNQSQPGEDREPDDSPIPRENGTAGNPKPTTTPAGESEAPNKPDESTTPPEPGETTEPPKPSKPDQPGEPDQPSKPDEPEPDKPKPDKPDKPKPDKPDKPDKPKPDKPDKPKPDKPDKPKPEKSTEPTEPAEPTAQP